MISFDCPHCGNMFEVEEKLAGRDGWCRVCKMMIIIPEPGATEVGELSLEERCDRLDKLLQFAATKADKYKRLIMEFHRDNVRLASQVHLADRTAEQIKEENDAARVTDTDSEGIADAITRLSEELDTERAKRSAAATAAKEERVELERTRAELAEATERLLTREMEMIAAERDDPVSDDTVPDGEAVHETAEESAPEGNNGDGRFRVSGAAEDRDEARGRSEGECLRLREELAEATFCLEELREESRQAVQGVEEEREALVAECARLEDETSRITNEHEASRKENRIAHADAEETRREIAKLRRDLEEERVKAAAKAREEKRDNGGDGLRYQDLEVQVDRLKSDLECERQTRSDLEKAVSSNGQPKIRAPRDIEKLDESEGQALENEETFQPTADLREPEAAGLVDVGGETVKGPTQLVVAEESMLPFGKMPHSHDSFVKGRGDMTGGEAVLPVRPMGEAPHHDEATLIDSLMRFMNREDDELHRPD